jgi:hypothetical protein
MRHILQTQVAEVPICPTLQIFLTTCSAACSIPETSGGQQKASECVERLG